LDWEDCVASDPKLFRPAEVDYLLGDPTKAQEKLGWRPRLSFEELIKRMVDHDLQLNQKGIVT
jgi:GDPmannose 4,6-dehydratase